ncbi:MAG: PEP-CTERM sorting domain-containing protein [Phycisphaerae bacterium]|nr:PEP-CTERM sorting domain-containing protein [Phycisphaerae bacterium]
MSITTSPCRWLSCVVLLSAAVLFASPAGADEWLEETHVFNFGFDAPAFDSTFEYNLDLPQFDTAGGTREIIGFRVDYSMYSDYTYTTNPNPTEQWHGCDLSWQQGWSTTLDGEQWFPLDQSSGRLDLTTGLGSVVGPFFPGTDPFSVEGAGMEHSEYHTDAELLARLTGDGIASIECTHALLALTVATPSARQWPAYVPQDQRIFDPELIDLTLDRIGMDVTVTYYWTPEPTSLALLGLGAVALLRRR